MTFIIVATSIVLLVALIVWIKVEPFIAFLITSILAGLLLGIPLTDISGSIQSGIGNLMGALVIVIVLGAMLGKIVADSGAAQRIAQFLMNGFGEKYQLGHCAYCFYRRHSFVFQCWVCFVGAFGLCSRLSV